MKYSVMSISDELDTQNLIKLYLSESRDEYFLIEQSTNSVAAFFMVSDTSPDIIVIKKDISFYNAEQFIRDMYPKIPTIQYILITEAEEEPIISLPSPSIISAIIPQNKLNRDTLTAAIKKSISDIVGKRTEKEELSNGQLFIISQNASRWLTQSSVFIKAINKRKRDSSTEVPNTSITADRNYTWILIAVPTPKKIIRRSFFTDLSELEDLHKRLQSLLKEYGGGRVFLTQENSFCFLIQPGELSDDSKKNSFEEFRDKMNRIFDWFEFVPMVLQRSDAPVGADGFISEYRTVESLEKYRFFVDDDRILCKRWISDNSIVVSNEVMQGKIESLAHPIRQHNKESLKKILDEIFLATKRSLSFTTYNYVWNRLTFFYNLQIRQYNLSEKCFIPITIHEENHHIDETFDIIKRCFENLIDEIASIQTSYLNPYINDAIAYVLNHIDEDTSLLRVSEKINVSASYLSRLFQKETGKSYVTVVNEYRIHEASKLLEKNRKIYDVARLTGYTNSKYFSRIFKSIVGITPIEYKRLKRSMPDYSY